ncbi:helix-turn-helix domain-containing protein [Escherichia coli]|nr:helix-turn-helix domain-containing protein [Escherichia coli]ELD6455493.1 helix-turn-helix domain-containing protein [Escherichia coli]
MSHPIIHIGRYHGGSDDWRTPYRLFKNLHRKPKVEVTQTIYCGDTMLLLAVVNRGGLRGRPHIHDAQTLDRLIKMHDQGQSVKSIAESLRMPLSTTYRIVQRLG